MADAGATTSQSIAADTVPLYIKKQLLQIAEKDVVFEDLGDEEDLPEGNGKVVQFSRYERLSLPTTPLTEGTSPTAQPLTVSTVNAILDQWGAVCSLTDVGMLIVSHPLLGIATSRLGTQQSELRDREIQKVLMGTSNVVFAGGKTTRATLVAGDNVTGDLIRQVVATLRALGAPQFDRGKFAGVVDPYVAMDIQKDPTFTNAAAYSNLTALLNAEIGTWLGVRWKESNLIPVLALLPSGDFTGGSNIASVAAAVGETGFTGGGTTVPVQVSRLDPVTGFETFVSAVTNFGVTATQTVAVTIPTGATTGTYNIYVGLDGATIPTLQSQVAHVSGDGGVTRTYIKSGTPNGAGHLVVQATGPVGPSATPASGNVHTSYVFGKSAFAVTKLGPKMEATLTPPVASDNDPLKQRRKAGWKNFFKACIKNVDFFRRIESLSAYN